LPDQIASELSAEILEGSYAPGAPVREQNLAARFETSRGPVREALRILERDQLIQMPPRRSARVVKMSHGEIAESFDIRAALFSMTAATAASVVVDEDVDGLSRSMRQVAEAIGRGEDPEVAGETACQALTEVSGNRKAGDILRTLERQCRLQYRSLAPLGRQTKVQIVATWQGLADAFEAGDADTVGKVATRLMALLQEAAYSALERAGRGKTDA